MKILTAAKAILAAHPTVTLRRAGGIWIARVDQNDARPNLMLSLPSQDDDWTHQGPTGLYDANVLVHARGDTDEAAGLLGEAVKAALNNYIGAVYDMTIHQCRLLGVSSAYDDKAEVFIHTSDFRIVFRSA